MECPAKVLAPKPRQSLTRLRLITLLETAILRSCLWINGPAGCGKTTLVVDYLRRNPDRDVLWYQFDAGDKDIANCFHYLSLAAGQIVPQLPKDLPVYSSAFIKDPAVFSCRFFERMFARLPRRFMLVFENFQQIDGAADIHRLLTIAIEALPPGCNVVVISRSPPAPAFARLLTNGQLSRIGWAEMKLSRDEIQTIAAEYGRTDLSDALIGNLERASRGWLAGLILLLISPDEVETDFSLGGRQPRALLHYFAHEIFAQFESATRRDLIKLAMLPVIYRSTARALTGNTSCWDRLTGLRDPSEFIEYLNGPRPMVQLHPLFRDFLLDLLKREYSPSQLDEMRRDAGRAIESAGLLQEAIDLYLEARSFEDAARLLCTVAPALVRQQRISVLRDKLDALPDDALTAVPRARYWLGICHLYQNPTQALAHFEVSLQDCGRQSDIAGAQFAWAGGVRAILSTWMGFDKLQAWIEIGRSLAPEDSSFASPAAEMTFTYGMSLALIYASPEDERVGELADQTIALMRRPQEQSLLLTIANLMLHHLMWMGQIAKGKIVIEIIGNQVSASGSSEEQHISWCAAVAMFDIARGEFESALALARAGLQLSQDSGIHAWQHKLRGVAIHANLLLGRAKDSRAHLDADAAALPQAQNLLWFHHHWLHAWYAWASGHPVDARERLNAAEQILASTGQPSLPQAKWHVACATIESALGDHAAARNHLTKVRRIARDVDSRFLLYQSQIMEAIMEIDDDEANCLRLGAQAMRTGADADLTYIDWLDRPSMARLCALLLRKGIATTHTSSLIRRMALDAPASTESAESWPWPVKIYGLGTSCLLVEGHAVGDESMRQRKVLDLLKALVAAGSRGMTVAQLAESLWPDAEADAAHNALKTTAHRLRQLLTRPDSLLVTDGSMHLNPDCVWVDAWEVEKLLTQSTDAPGRRLRLQNAIELYHGPLFEAHDAPSLLPERSRLQQLVCHAIDELGRYWERMEEWPQAIELYEMGLTVDEIAEPLYRRLMVCHEQLGHHVDAIMTYEKCRESLDRNLGVRPSRLTRSLAEEIRHH